MVEAPRLALQTESQLEEWLSNSPWAVANEDLLIIGRQTRASIANNARVPDLLALDSDGRIVVVELKKGRAPREVVAQILEYAAWAATLSHSSIVEIGSSFLSQDLSAKFVEYFEVDDCPAFGRLLRLFIAAEEIPGCVSETCRFLRQNLGLDISCVSYKAYRDAAGNTLVDSSLIVGSENMAVSSVGLVGGGISDRQNRAPWNGTTPVKEIIWKAVQELTAGDNDLEFSPKSIVTHIAPKYPGVNKGTIRCQLASDCVNHTSRHHWPGGTDRYWLVKPGTYRLLRPTDLPS